MSIDSQVFEQAVTVGKLLLESSTAADRGAKLLSDLADALTKAITEASPDVQEAPRPTPAHVPPAPPVAPAPAAPAVAVATPATVEPAAAPAPVAPVAPPAPPAPPVAPAPAAASAVESPAKPETKVMTAVDLNAALVEEFQRLGAREGILAEMAKMGAKSVNDLEPEQYQDLLDAVRALKKEGE